MIIEILLALILLANLSWATIWYYRKTQNLEYKVSKFLSKQKMKPQFNNDLISISSDTSQE